MVGILLLLCVVVLWTTSNFVTQVRFVRWVPVRRVTSFPRICSKAAMRSHSCMFPPLLRLGYLLIFVSRVTYLNTSAFVLYLLPFTIRRTQSKSHRNAGGGG